MRLQLYCFSYPLQTSINYSSLYWFNIASPHVPQKGQAQRDFTLSLFHLCNTCVSLLHVPAPWFKCFFSSLLRGTGTKSLRWLVFSTQHVNSWKHMPWPQSSKALGQMHKAEHTGSPCLGLPLPSHLNRFSKALIEYNYQQQTTHMLDVSGFLVL